MSFWQLINNADNDSIHSNNIIKSQFSYFIDEQAILTIDDVRQKNIQFLSSSSKDIPFELSVSAYWVKVNIENITTVEQTIILYTDNTTLAEFDAYSEVEDKILAMNRINIAKQAFPHIELILNKKSNKTVYLRIKTSGHPNVPFVLYTNEAFKNRTNLSLLLFGLFMGIVIIMSIYNLVLYSAIKDKVFLLYIGYLLSTFLVLSMVNGYSYLIFSEPIQKFLDTYLLFLDYALVNFLLLFTLYFLRYDLNKSNSYKIGISISFLLAFSSVATLYLDLIKQIQIFLSIQPFVFIFALFIVTRRLRNDFSWARFYFISWIPLLVGAVVQPLMLLNYIEYSFFTRHAFLLGVMFEIAFIALALAERMRRNEQDRLFELSYHTQTELPRKSTLENALSQCRLKNLKKYSVVIIKPENIQHIKQYTDEIAVYELFIKLNHKLSSLFAYNDAVLTLTNNHEKICLLNEYSLAVLVNEDKNEQSYDLIVKSMHKLVKEVYQVKQLKLPLGVVVGIATYPEHGQTSQALINNAKKALKNAESKSEHWAFYTNNSADNPEFLFEMALDIKEAIDNNDFQLYHQPQIDLKTLRVCGSECLIRWEHQIKGFIPPKVFIPIAEDVGLINQITLWVIKQALIQHSEITQSNKFNHMVSINISGIDIVSDQFYKKVVELVNSSEIAPEKIIFEITESSSIIMKEKAKHTIEKLTDFGITISINDLGTGYSSKSSVEKLFFNELKLNRFFVTNICDDSKRKIIAETTVKMAKNLGLEVVAEGISSQLDENILRKFGCDIGQGHYYSQALPLAEYLDWLSVQVNGQPPIHYYGEFMPANKNV